MTEEPAGKSTTSLLSRPVTRRAVVGGSLAAASAAVAYAALGPGRNLIGGGSSAGDESAAAVLASRGDADAIQSESVKVSHLLRRAGFGVTRDEFDRYQSMGLQKTLDEVLNYQSVNDDAAVALANQIDVTDPSTRGAAIPWWLIRMANTQRPLQEKMTLFWHGLLTSQISNVKDPTAMVAQNEFYRAHAFDSFPAILHGIWQDPAMMVYLDVDGSSLRAPNENYARELMELFSLGVGNYTETDVREAARAFTGWNVAKYRVDDNTRGLGDAIFRPQLFDSGTKTFLGKTGNLKPDDIVDAIAAQPASARYIVGRLFGFFVAPDATDADLAPFVDVYNKNGGSVGAVVSAMLRSDVFYSPRAYRSLVKSPIEYGIGAAKALGVTQDIAQLLIAGASVKNGGGYLGEMGQVPFEPPNVAGWPGGAAWLNSATIFARLNLLNVLTGGGDLDSTAYQGPSPEALKRLQQAKAQGSLTPEQQDRLQRAMSRPPQQKPNQALPSTTDLGMTSQALDYYLPLVLDNNVPDASRQVLVDYAGGADAKLSGDGLRDLAYLILGSPQFHLA